MKNLKNNVIGLTLGIRFNRSFRIPDISGDIIDNVLYGNKTPFGQDFFPKVQENSNREKTLYNPKTSEYLRINTDDVILGIEIKDNFDDKFDWLKNDVLDYFKNTLFLEYKIENIRRLGIIFSHKISKTKKMCEAISVLTGNAVPEADNISVSFSKKDTAIQGFIKKGVSDFKNQIYNIQELKEAIYADLDYQYYYEPAIEDLRECFADKVLDDAKFFLESNFYAWLNKYENAKEQ